MLETSQERVVLLKAGIDGKTIEKLYVLWNDFKIVHLVKINSQVNENPVISQEAAVESSL